MAANPSAGPSVALAVSLAVIAAGICRWQGSVFRAHRTEIPGEPWEHVTRHYPISQGRPSAPLLSPETGEALVRANPFSPQRRFSPVPVGGTAGGGSAGVSESTAPQFLYKGRIDVGNRQRAIVEETTARKTYFLEVGQEVAGFKVLDIAENRVVLSEPQTNQEVVVTLASPAQNSP